MVTLRIISSSHHPSQSDQYFFENLDKDLDVYSTYEKVLTAGDFNAAEGDKCLDIILYQHELKSLNKEATCYKNPNKPKCIDLILTNSPRSFFNTETYFTGLSDCHKRLPDYQTVAEAYPQKQYMTIPVLKRIS